jgi:hypothetical protein
VGTLRWNYAVSYSSHTPHAGAKCELANEPRYVYRLLSLVADGINHHVKCCMNAPVGYEQDKHDTQEQPTKNTPQISPVPRVAVQIK